MIDPEILKRRMAILGTCAGICSRMLDLTVGGVARRHKGLGTEVVSKDMTWLKHQGYITQTHKEHMSNWVYVVTGKGWEKSGVRRPMGVGE